MYDGLYDSVGVLEPCTEPAPGSLRYGLAWDERNRKHFRERLRLSPGEVDAGVDAGYLFLEEDQEDCRYRYLFRPEPSPSARQQAPIYRLIIDTSEGTLRPITVFEETNVTAQERYREVQLHGDLE